ncbi:DUF6090 family protein [Chryseolinea sp. T2]|uniref:DUF6090 family protein n=1 Tax=Chryseolinea sp. T2 TaxID=3129255 RepID=UPI003076E399
MDKARILRITVLGIGQSVLIIASVLIAAWVENLREERQNREMGRSLLSEMLRELKDDAANLNRDLPSVNKQSAAANRMVSALVTTRVPDDSIRRIIARLNYYNAYQFHSATFETFKSVGFNLIENDSLRIRIMQFYEFREQRTINLAQVSYDQVFNYYVPILHEHFKDFSMNEGATPVSVEKLAHNNKVIEFFRVWRDLLEVEYLDSGTILQQTKDLINMLEKELAKYH